MSLARSFRVYRSSVKHLFGDFERPAPIEPSTNERIVLVFSQRSGSNLMASSLHANRIAKKAIPRYSTRDLKALSPRPESFVAASHVIASDIPEPTHRWHRSSVKMGWRQLLLLAQNGAFADEGAYPPDRTVIIRIHRADTLRQAVSLVKASQSDEWYHFTEEAGGNPSASAAPTDQDYVFDPERITTRAATFDAAAAVTERILDAIGADVFSTTYEEFTADERDVMGRLRRRVDPSDDGEPVLQKSFHKQASEINEDWYARTQEWMATRAGHDLAATLKQGQADDQEFIDKAAERAANATRHRKVGS